MERPIRVGVIGLGRAFSLMKSTLILDPRVVVVAGTDPRTEAGVRFAKEFGGIAHASAEALCADSQVELVYIASPHSAHVDHVRLAAEAGKHILVEKPMALTLADCRSMIASARRAGVQLFVGHSHSFDRPYRLTRSLIDSGEFGSVRMITAMNFTDFLYRPRRPEELDTSRGGGAVFSQAAHQVDVVRYLAGARTIAVRATTGNWDMSRPTEGAYAAHLTFENGVFASLTYSGYAHFDSDRYQGWIGETGKRRDPLSYGEARSRIRALGSPEEEIVLKNAAGYGATTAEALPPTAYHHFGLVIVSCDKGDLRPTPFGVEIYGDQTSSQENLPSPVSPRSEVIDEIFNVLRNGERPIHTGEWGMATVETCLALLTSSRDGTVVTL